MDGNLSIGFYFDKAKTDLAKRQVWGYATVEEVDQQNDIVDYDASVSAFKAWAGNIREQHDPKRAIGKAIEITPDPTKRGIWMGAYLSKTPDGDAALTKITEGILKGFSIGGKVEATRPESLAKGDGTKRLARRITKYSLSECSIVDNPASPSSQILMVKSADGLPVAEDLLAKGEGAGGGDGDSVPLDDKGGSMNPPADESPKAEAPSAVPLDGEAASSDDDKQGDNVDGNEDAPGGRTEGAVKTPASGDTDSPTKAAAEGDLGKAGARHSSTDRTDLQAAHDALVKLGAACPCDTKATTTGDLAKAEDIDSMKPEELQKMIGGAVGESLTKVLEPALAKFATGDDLKKAMDAISLLGTELEAVKAAQGEVKAKVDVIAAQPAVAIPATRAVAALHKTLGEEPGEDERMAKKAAIDAALKVVAPGSRAREYLGYEAALLETRDIFAGRG